MCSKVNKMILVFTYNGSLEYHGWIFFFSFCFLCWKLHYMTIKISTCIRKNTFKFTFHICLMATYCGDCTYVVWRPFCKIILLNFFNFSALLLYIKYCSEVWGLYIFFMFLKGLILCLFYQKKTKKKQQNS